MGPCKVCAPSVPVSGVPSPNKGSKSEAPFVLYIVGAEWCGPCHALWTVVERIAPKRNRLGWEAWWIDAESQANQPWVNYYEVRAYPTLLLLRGDRLIGREVGGMDEKRLRAWIGNHRKR